MAIDLTARQRRVLRLIESYTAKHGYPPSIREMMASLKIASPNGINCHLRSLKTKGYVSWHPTLARTLRVLKPVT